jgi:hypothetical protein
MGGMNLFRLGRDPAVGSGQPDKGAVAWNRHLRHGKRVLSPMELELVRMLGVASSCPPVGGPRRSNLVC